MDKEIALAFNFKDAPEDVVAAGEAHRENFVRLEKAKNQVALWTAELESARSDSGKTLKVFQERINSWLKTSKREELAGDVKVSR